MDAMMKEELALMYITGKLDSADKMEVFSLLTSDQEFREIFMEEKKLYNKLKILKKDMDPTRSKMLFDKIMEGTTEEPKEVNISKRTMNLLLKNLIPEKLYDLINYSNGGILAHG